MTLHARTLLLSLVMVGCGPALPPPAPPPTPVPAPKPPPPDVTAVPTPANLVFFARLSNPAASVKVATDWARLPSLDTRKFVEGMIESMTDGKAFSPLAAIVDVAQPIELAASFEMKMPPKPLGAFAAGVKNLDEATSSLAATFDLQPGDNGILHVVRKPGPAGEKLAKGEDADDAACDLTPAAGAAPYRLVCALSRDALAALGPYLARTTPRRAFESDLHVELIAGPIGGLASLGRMQIQNLVPIIAARLEVDPAKYRATTELATSAIGDFFDYVADLDAITVDATLDPAHAGLRFRTTFKSASSFLAQVTTSHPERADVPPDAFWRLPGDVDLATFAGSIDDALLQHPRDLVVAALAEQLAVKKVRDVDGRAVTDVVKGMIHSSRGLFAHGAVDAASYWLIERDESPSVTEKLVRDLVAAWNRPGLAQWRQGGADKGASAETTMKLGSALPGLPPGSVHVVITVPAETPKTKTARPNGLKGTVAAGTKPLHLPKLAAAPAKPPSVYHLAVVPDGAKSWLAISTSDLLLRSVVAGTTGTTRRPDNLGARATARALDGFKEARMTTGGFVTVRAFGELGRWMDENEGPSREHASRHVDPSRWDALLGHLPAKGMTPITFTASGGAPTAEAAGGVHELHVDVPADAIRDAVWLGLELDSLAPN